MFNRSLVLLGCLFSFANAGYGFDTYTVSGTVRDSYTHQALDSTSVEVYDLSSGFTYTVTTNTSGFWSVDVPTLVGDRRALLPKTFSVGQNYPNPFNPSTRFRIELPAAGRVRLTVHSLLGQLLDERELDLGAGSHEIEWRSKGAAGVLFYSVEFNGGRQTRKMIQLDGGGAGGFGEAHSIATVTGEPVRMGKVTGGTYRIVAARFAYEPDTASIVVEGNTINNIALESIHRRALLWDLHNDVLEKVAVGYDLGSRHTYNHSDIPRWRDGGLDAQMFAVWIDPGSDPSLYYAHTIAMIDSFKSQETMNSTMLRQARTADSVLDVVATGKIAGIIGVEGGHSIEHDLSKLKELYNRGARYLTITWNNSTDWAVSAADAQSTTVGLSDFGKEVIRTMDSLGMIIDVAHTGIKTIDDILATTENPIIDSHAGARALRDSYRDLTDDQIRAIAQSGGVIGVCFYPPFIGRGVATIDTVIKHIDYIKNLVGIDYVAIGSDFDGIESTPVGLEDVSKYPALTLALLRHGYTRDEVRKILGENYLRVFRQVCK